MDLIPEKITFEVSHELSSTAMLLGGLLIVGIGMLTFYAWVQTKFK